MKAEESPQIQKARIKLKKQIEREHKLISKKAIKQMKQAIQIWIERHQSERVKLPIKKLFDKNLHSAKEKSGFVNKLMKSLKKEAAKTKSYLPLIGRIRKD